jgi:hypothetical protein
VENRSRSPVVRSPVYAAEPSPAYATEAPRHYGSSTALRIRHRVIEKRERHRQEVREADAEWVNPPFGAGE